MRSTKSLSLLTITVSRRDASCIEDLAILCIAQAQVTYRMCVYAKGFGKSGRQGRRQLGIEPEDHATNRAMSARLAARSRHPWMSSASRSGSRTEPLRHSRLRQASRGYRRCACAFRECRAAPHCLGWVVIRASSRCLSKAPNPLVRSPYRQAECRAIMPPCPC